MKIGFFDAEGWEQPMLDQAFAGHEVAMSSEHIDPLHIPATTDFDALSIFVSSRITEDVLAHFPNLKFIVTRSTGFDHIDRAACAARGIGVSYVPGYGDNTVAEFAFGLLLALTRKITAAAQRVQEEHSFSCDGLRGIDLKGKTLGVIGTGRIGKEAIRIGKGFGMQVVAFDPFPDLAAAGTLGYSYLPLNDLLAQADAITIHAPLTPQTTHLINKENIGLMKHGAYLVNTARGGIIETEALATALKNGGLAGAALDVLEEEGEIKDELGFLANGHPKESDLKVLLENHALMNMPNVIVTPHNAFNTQEALERILKTSIDDLRGFIAQAPVNLVPAQA